MHRVIGYRPDGKGKGTVRRISQVVKRSMGMLQGERECEDDEDDKGKVGWSRIGKANWLIVKPDLYALDHASPSPESGPEMVVLSSVVQISSSDYYLTADGGYRGASSFSPEFATVKPSCTNEQPDIAPFKTDFNVVKDNIKWLQDVAITDGFVLKCGLVPPYTDNFRFKVYHVLFKPLQCSEASTDNAEDRESSDKVDDLDGIFLIGNWLTFNDTTKGGLENIKKTHHVVPIPAYNMKGNLIDPHQYHHALEGATVELHFTLTHWSFSAKADQPVSMCVDTYTGDIVMICVISPPIYTPGTPSKCTVSQFFDPNQ
ncbi:uncharacterized protein EDB93DRAFT_1255256 [Suillus bovinus]|uniref:uncharacterized protein n=1 Tax=Suillus bovinus TaxID=48563 RepID=UPI001B867972|nr:uncharacterized protein EDB93DRAFT_1255256 [Suillus bovinus]KAG2132277.1 hypothetical protein EDB93DRAFT_1255256 [Suillus bovinus]